MDAWTFLAAPFAASLILAGIHTYLGVHVVERGVIFVDISLAQFAALGAAVAILLGTDAHSASTYWVSVTFTLVGAALFSTIRGRSARIPQEAVIGICYAVASAATILAMSQARGEIEHLQEMLVGNLLFVSWEQVERTALLYSLIGAFHYIFRSSFLAISTNHDLERVKGVSVKVWDMLIYASFGVVVTSSVSMAGVLLVFCYLIVPSVGGMLFARTIGRRLMIGWAMGTVVSAAGVFLSLHLDLPTGPTIVCTFGIVLAVMALVRLAIGPLKAATQ